MTELEKMQAFLPYDAKDPEMQKVFMQTNLLVERLNAISCTDGKARFEILKELLGSISESAFIKGQFYCNYGHNIHLADGVFINEGCNLMDDNRIELGKQVLLGPSCLLITSNHPLAYPERIYEAEDGHMGVLSYSAPIVIEEGAWLAARVTVLPGVTIGRGSVIGAGSVVTKDVPPGMLAVGVPAKVIRPTTSKQ